MGNVFAYFVATNIIEPIANRWQLRILKKKYKKSPVLTYDSPSISLEDTDSSLSSNRTSIQSFEDENEDESNPSLQHVAKIGPVILLILFRFL